MKTITLIYERMIQGGIGYSPLLFRVGNKYYTVRGDTEADNYRKLAALEFPKKRDGHALWMKHRNDNEITAGDFLKIVDAIYEDYIPSGDFQMTPDKYVGL